MHERLLITPALPYANGPLHFGHMAGAYLPADCYARFERLQGKEVLFICGTDEYGVAITLSAELAGRTPKQHVDHFHDVIHRIFKQFNIQFDHFSRTTWHGHNAPVEQFFKDLLENGYIEERTTEQLYSELDRRFLADRYVVGTCPKCGFLEARGDECPRCAASYEATDLLNPRSKMSGAPLKLKPTKHWFLRFDLFKDRLMDWMGKKQWKGNVFNFAKAYIDDLKPRAITRDSEWGVPVPLEGAKGKVLYVWFDAPIGYISATKDWAQRKGTPDAWKDYWLDPNTRYVQFIGKDNIPFHAVFFPAMVMGQNHPYKLVDELPANEFFNLEGRQFSKSDGWYIELDDFFTKFSADQIRYAIAANAPENQDAEFSWKDFQMRCNVELLGKYGNLANRTLVFAAQHCHSKVPSIAALEGDDHDFLAKISGIAEEIAKAYRAFQMRRASQLIMELAHAGNVYFDAKKPWVLAKNPATHEQMRTAIACCLECLKLLALTSAPIIPDAAEKLWSLLGYAKPLHTHRWDLVVQEKIPSEQHLPQPTILFNKIEDETIAAEQAKLVKIAEKKTIAELPIKEPAITIDDVRKLDLRVAQILSVERIAKSKKLLKLQVDLGFEKRTVVAGIGEKLEDIQSLIGKKVMLVANLKPATILGVESQGMLLVADAATGLEPPTFHAALPGNPIS